jgi:death on curing protein
MRAPDSKAAALLHTPSPVTTPPIDRGRRLALAAVIAFYGLNGRRPILANDAAKTW